MLTEPTYRVEYGNLSLRETEWADLPLPVGR